MCGGEAELGDLGTRRVIAQGVACFGDVRGRQESSHEEGSPNGRVDGSSHCANPFFCLPPAIVRFSL